MVKLTLNLNCARIMTHLNKKSTYGKFRKRLIIWCRGTESNCRHGDFQFKISKSEKQCNYRQLILLKIFYAFLVSFGTIWKYLTLTGTIWAQLRSLAIDQDGRKSSETSVIASGHYH